MQTLMGHPWTGNTERDQHEARDMISMHGTARGAGMMNTNDLLENNPDLILDLCRYSEGSLQEKQIRRKYRHLSNNIWDSPDDALVDLVEAAKIQRVRNGACAREKAQLLHTAAPDVLGGILNDNSANAKHRIEASRELRTVAANGPEAAPHSDRFQIIINLGADTVLSFDKPRAIGPDDPDRVDIAALATITTSKPTDGNDGGPQPI
jgi:hypothetical protein